MQVWGVGGKFGTSAAVGIVLPPAPQMVQKQGWTYVSRPSQLLRGAHEPQSDITSIAFSKVCMCVCMDVWVCGLGLGVVRACGWLWVLGWVLGECWGSVRVRVDAFVCVLTPLVAPPERGHTTPT